MPEAAQLPAGQGDATTQPDEMASQVTVTVLLAGTPTPTASKWGTAILVRSATTTVLVDAGPGATRSLVRAGLGPTEVDAVVFSHHHFDHNAGFPAFFLSRWDQGAGLIDDLLVYGPPPTVGFVDRLFATGSGAFWPDLHARISAPVSQAVYVNRGGRLPRRPPDPQVRDVHPGDGFTIGDIRFTPGLARHVQPYLDSNAYRIEVGSGSIVYTGDTEPCDEVAELARGTDLLVSMCWDEERTMVESGESPGQTGTLGAARIAAQAEAGTLVLTHRGPNIGAGIEERELAAMADIYSGVIHQADEGSTFGVSAGQTRVVVA